MSNEYKLGKGKAFIDLLDASGNSIEGERYLGNTPGFSVTVDSQTLEHYSSEAGISEKDAEVLQQVSRTINITFDSMSRENLALFVSGSLADITQGTGSVTSEAHNGVKQGYFYQLGQDSSNPSGVRSVSSVVVNGSGGTPTYVEGTDYNVDLTLARIEIIAGGGISDGDDLEIDYDLDAVGWEQVAATSAAAVSAAIRFIADNPTGENDDMYIPLCNVRPTGELPMIGTDWQQAQLECEALKPSSGAAIYIDGRPA